MSSSFNLKPSEFNYDAVVNTDRTIPSNLRFSNLTPMGLVSIAKKFIFRPTNQNTFSESNNVIQIPIASSTSVIDPQLVLQQFDIKNDEALAVPASASAADVAAANLANYNNTMQIDNCIDVIIAGFRLFSRNGGVDAETLRYYNQLIAILYDTEFNVWKRQNLKTIQGFGDASSSYEVDEKSKVSFNSGKLGTKELVIGPGETHTFCIPFLSSLLGLLQTKYFLTPLMGQCDLEIILNPNFYINTAGSPSKKLKWTLSNWEMHCQLISFQDPIIERLKAVAATTGIYIHGQQWSGYQQAISANTNTIVISERLRSVNNVLLTFAVDRGDNYQRRQQSRITNNLRSLQLKIGDNYYPTQPIKGDASDPRKNSEFLCEYYKSMCLLHNVNNTGIIDGYNYALNDEKTFTADVSGKFVAGVEIASFSKPENPIECGVDLGANGPLNILISSEGGAGGKNCYAYVFMNYDVVYSILQDGRFVVAK